MPFLIFTFLFTYTYRPFTTPSSITAQHNTTQHHTAQHHILPMQLIQHNTTYQLYNLNKQTMSTQTLLNDGMQS